MSKTNSSKGIKSMTLIEQFEAFRRLLDSNKGYRYDWSPLFQTSNLVIASPNEAIHTGKHLHFFLKDVNFILMAHTKSFRDPINKWTWDQSGPFLNNQLKDGMINPYNWGWHDTSIKSLSAIVFSEDISLMLFSEEAMIRQLGKYLIENKQKT